MPHARVALLAGLIGQFPLSCGGVWRRAGPVGDCLDAVPGDACHKFVTWALDRGLEEHPEWFPSFKRSDSEEWLPSSPLLISLGPISQEGGGFRRIRGLLQSTRSLDSEQI